MVDYWKDSGTLGCVPFGEEYDTIAEHELLCEHDLFITLLLHRAT